MKRRHTILMVGPLAALLLCGALRAEGDDRRAKVRGTFLKRAELRIKGRGFLAIVIGPADSETTMTLVVSEGKDLLRAARRLRKGQKIVVVYVVEAGRKWAQRIEVIRGDDDEKNKDKDKDKDKDKGKHADIPLDKQVAELRQRVEQMEKQLRHLSEENAHLKRRLAELETAGKTHAGMDKDKQDRKKPEKADDHGDLPDGIIGFRGILIGTVAKKLDVGFVLKVAKIGKVWKESKARNPKAAVGKQLKLVIPAKSRLSSRHQRTLRTLQPGDRVSVGAFHHEGDRLTIVEEFRRID